MSFKFVLVCATLAVASCARMDQQELNRQMQQQQEMIQQQNEHIREHHRVENNQRQAQMRDLEDQVRQQDQLARDQEQLIRDQEQQVRDNKRVDGNVFALPRPHFVNVPIQFASVPSSFRNFERSDDSNYNFAYAVSDLTTGDVKSQNEIRRGDQVQGRYSMMDSDGYQRTVEYRADDKNGFDAEVRREPAQGLFATPQFIRIDDSNHFATHFFHPANQFFALRPTIYATTSVSRRDDGQRNEYTTATASNF